MEQIQLVEEPIVEKCLEAIIAVCGLTPSTQKTALIDCLVEVIDKTLNPPMIVGSGHQSGTTR
jgi:hypothetical protein